MHIHILVVCIPFLRYLRAQFVFRIPIPQIDNNKKEYPDDLLLAHTPNYICTHKTEKFKHYSHFSFYLGEFETKFYGAAFTLYFVCRHILLYECIGFGVCFIII